MTTLKIYETNGAQGDFTANVINCEARGDGRYDIVLDRTAFFPEGGGQSSDKGTLGGQEILELRTDRDRNVIRHTVSHPIDVGTEVQGRVDMVKRFSDMQNHTAEHIVSGTVHSMYGYDNIGFHMGSDVITMDFNGILTGEQLALVEERANKAVYANIPIKIAFYEPNALAGVCFRSKIEFNTTVRLVEIEGVDVCACCAPHVARTGEIGLIKTLDFQKYKGGTRVSMLAGSRAFAELSKRFSQVKSLSASLSAKPDAIEERIVQLQNELGALKGEKSAIYAKYCALRAEVWIRTESLLRAEACSASNKNGVLLFEESGSIDELRMLVNTLKDKISGICAAFAPDAAADAQAERYKFVIGTSEDTDLKSVTELLRNKCGASCGGRGNMIQGSVNSSREDIKSVLSDFIY